LDIQEAWRSKFRINLETPRLLLRPLVTDDLDWIAALCLDPDVNRFLWDCAATLEQARRVAEAIVYLDLHKCHFGHWAIQDRNSSVIHGWVELGKLRPWSGPSDEIALSYVLRRESWGQGIATEASGRLLRYAFATHDLDRVMAVTMNGNRASKRVLAKLGMRAIKTTRTAQGKRLQYFQIDAPAAAQP
jgi:RimJ/RimL family protein N-acetyltransferase